MHAHHEYNILCTEYIVQFLCYNVNIHRNSPNEDCYFFESEAI
jgi:hypothetical protein